MNKSKFDFTDDISVDNNVYRVNFNLRSGNIDFPAYKVFSEDGKLHFEIELDTAKPGKYKVSHAYNLPEKGIVRDIEKEINQIFDEKRKSGEYPPSL